MQHDPLSLGHSCAAECAQLEPTALPDHGVKTALVLHVLDQGSFTYCLSQNRRGWEAQRPVEVTLGASALLANRLFELALLISEPL